MGDQAVAVDFSNLNPQGQSPLFGMLPLDIRMLIYFQYWLDQGITHHIHSLGPQCYLSHYPCLLEADAFNHHHPHVPPAPVSTAPEPQEDNEVPENEQGDQQLQGGQQPDNSYDDPGDINSAIQDIAGSQVPTQPSDSANYLDSWKASPWCVHDRCCSAFLALYGLYTLTLVHRRHRKGRQHELGSKPPPLTKPLIVCKAMYLEASRSMYSMLRFSFSCQRALTHFAEQVPRALTERIQVIDVVLSPDYEDGALPELCQTLGNSFPGVQELRISLHPSRQIPIRPLPDRAYLEPLYALAHTLNQPRKFEIKLPIEGDKFASTRAYGATDYLGDVPFNVTLVPRGSHILYHCTGFNA